MISFPPSIVLFVYSCMPRQSLSLTPSFSLSHFLLLSIDGNLSEMFTTTHLKAPPPFCSALWTVNMSTVSFCGLYLRPSLSLSLCTRGQMWRRDSGEFVLSKCKVRRRSQLAEAEGAQSQQLNRVDYRCTRLNSLPECLGLHEMCNTSSWKWAVHDARLLKASSVCVERRPVEHQQLSPVLVCEADCKREG